MPCYTYGICSRIRLSSVGSTSTPRRYWRFRLLLFLVRMWRPKALDRRILPVPVFAKRFAAPRRVLSLGTFDLLQQRLGLVLRLVVNTINGVDNRFGGDARARAADPEFYTLLGALRRIQLSGTMGMRVHRTPDQEATLLTFRARRDPKVEADVAEVRKLLGLDPNASEFSVVYGSSATHDKEIAILTRSILERAGYRVIEAANGIEGLQAFKNCGAKIDLALTDVVMPDGMSGLELAKKLQTLQPDLRVVLMSGYSTDFAGRELALQVHQSFLQKPATPKQLLEAVRGSLDR